MRRRRDGEELVPVEVHFAVDARATRCPLNVVFLKNSALSPCCAFSSLRNAVDGIGTGKTIDQLDPCAYTAFGPEALLHTFKR